MERKADVSPDIRWDLAVEWQNATFELFMQAQRSMGRSEAEAYDVLRKVWERESRERLEGWRRAARITARAG